MSINADDAKYGLIACGSSRSWDVSVDESIGGDELIAEINGPNIDLAFHLRDLSVVSEVHKFLAIHLNSEVRNRPTNPSLTLGNFHQNAVSLIADNEFSDRCFLNVGDSGPSHMRLMLLREDIEMLMEAFRQADADLE